MRYENSTGLLPGAVWMWKRRSTCVRRCDDGEFDAGFNLFVAADEGCEENFDGYFDLDGRCRVAMVERDCLSHDHATARPSEVEPKLCLRGGVAHPGRGIPHHVIDN